jgi:hypothetical protein
MIPEHRLEAVRYNTLPTSYEVAIHENILTAFATRLTTQKFSQIFEMWNIPDNYKTNKNHIGY